MSSTKARKRVNAACRERLAKPKRIPRELTPEEQALSVLLFDAIDAKHRCPWCGDPISPDAVSCNQCRRDFCEASPPAEAR